MSRVAALAFGFGALLLVGCATDAAGRRWVRDLTLVGVKGVDDDTIVEGLRTQETAWWPFATKRWFDADALDVDVRRIEAFYAARGFFRARVIDRKIVPKKDGRAVDVQLTVEEGKATTVIAVDVRGVARLPADVRTNLAAPLPLKRGERFAYRRYLTSKGALVRRLDGAGYAYAQVTGDVRVDRDRGTARVRFDAKPGPRVRFGVARIKGNGAIPADKLRNLATWSAGDRYDKRELARTRARLFRQRVFSSVRTELPVQPTAVANVDVIVQPSALHEVRLGVGAGLERRRHEVRLSARWTLKNFLGGLRTLTMRLQPSYVAMPAVWDAERHGPAIESDVRLGQPDAFGSGISLVGLVGYDLGIHEGYRFHGPRARAAAERSFFSTDALRIGLSWNLQFLDFFDFDAKTFDPAQTRLSVGFIDPYRLAWLEPFVQLDLRDHILDPRFGLFAEVRVEAGLTAIGSDFTYLKVTPDLRGYVPLGTKRIVVAVRGSLTWLKPNDGIDSPITRRATLGGPNSHRGFTFGRLSPFSVDSAGRSIPLGGNGAVLLSADMRLRVFKLFDNWLGLTGFFDAGDATPGFDDIDFSNLHLAVGGALKYDTPVGAIQLAFAFRLNRLAETAKNARPQNPDPGERFAFHLTLGEAF